MFKTAKIKYLLAVPAIAFAALGVAACGGSQADSGQPAVQVASPRHKAQDKRSPARSKPQPMGAATQIDQLEKKLKRQYE